MVKFIHKITGCEMWVAEDRVEEFKAAGHKLAVEPPKTKAPAKKKAARK